MAYREWLDKYLVTLEKSGNQYSVGLVKKAMIAPSCPVAGKIIMAWSNKLMTFREYDGMSGTPLPISPLVVDAWARRASINLTPFEFDLLLDLDLLFRNTVGSSDDSGALSQEEKNVIEWVKSAKLAVTF